VRVVDMACLSAAGGSSRFNSGPAVESASL
jgi:hypothetical protein